MIGLLLMGALMAGWFVDAAGATALIVFDEFALFQPIHDAIAQFFAGFGI